MILRYAGGREVTLRELQAMGMTSGINALIVGNYLTTLGRSPDEDLQMLDDLRMPIGALSKVDLRPCERCRGRPRRGVLPVVRRGRGGCDGVAVPARPRPAALLPDVRTAHAGAGDPDGRGPPRVATTARS